MQQLLSNLTSALGRANATARGLAANATQSAQGTLQNALLNSLGSQALSTRIDLGAALGPSCPKARLGPHGAHSYRCWFRIA